jgi:hypothetical protein
MAKRNIFRLIFDSETGKLTNEDGSALPVGADFTFEDHPGYNPLQYATEETAKKIVDAIRPALPSDVVIASHKTETHGPVAPPPQAQILFFRWGITAEFNAGLIANSIIRSGSLNSVLAELKTAGILF